MLRVREFCRLHSLGTGSNAGDQNMPHMFKLLQQVVAETACSFLSSRSCFQSFTYPRKSWANWYLRWANRTRSCSHDLTSDFCGRPIVIVDLQIHYDAILHQPATPPKKEHGLSSWCWASLSKMRGARWWRHTPNNSHYSYQDRKFIPTH